MKRPHSSLSGEMHLRNGEHVSHFSGAQDEHIAKKVQNNGASKTHEQVSTKNGNHVAVNTNGHSSKVNEVRARVPSDLAPDAVLDTILAAWTILMHRYQRDVFHQFTWGVVNANGRTTQCVNTTELNLTNQRTAASLKAQISNVRSKDYDAHNVTLFLNDGSTHEWTFEVSLDREGDSLHLTSRWQTNTMSRHQAVSQLHFFVSILDTLFSDPESLLSSFMNVSEEELDELWSWNSPLQPELRFCMHEKVSEQAALHPEKIAIDAWDGTLTYRQVEDYSTNLAQTLQLLDDSPNQIIPVLFEKSRWTSVAVLAIMKAGACFALLDPAQPEGRLRAVVQQVNAKLFVSSKSQSKLAARVAPAATIIPISASKFDKVYSPCAAQQPKTTLPPVSPDQPLYIQFTSGSTGLPKGCILTHSQYTSGAIPRADAVGYRSHSRVLDFASYAFDHLPADTQLAVEVIKPSGGGEQTLVAFLVEQKKNGMRHLDGNAFGSFTTKFQSALKEMTKQLAIDLPGYMVPSAYIPLWKMPLLVSCKTDRKRLREIGTSVTRQDLRRFNSVISEKKEPTTETELKLQSLWAKLLGGDADFSANDNFFSMGGDSLRAMRLVAAAREAELVLNVPDIMLNPTLSAMAAKAKPLSEEATNDVPAFSLIEKSWDVKSAKTETAKLCGVDVEEVEDVYPCTPLQEGLMALSAKFQDAYVAQRIATLPSATAQRLKEAFDTAVQGSPILRTRIVNVSGRGLFQVVLKDGQLVREHGADPAEYLRRDREEPMDLGTALFRYGLVREAGSDKTHFVITMHHAVYDGWSMPLVFDRINRAFNGLKTERSVFFKNFIKHLTSLDPAEAQDYWRERLNGTSPHQFPPLPQKGYITQADSLLEHYVTVPTTAHNKLTLATIIRGAWALVCSLYMGHPDVVFGETLTGRSAPVNGIEEIEGPMITTVPIRVRLSLDRPISEYLQAVHAQTVRQIPHEHLGLQNIRRLSKGARVACDLRTGLVLHPREDDVGEVDMDAVPANTFLPADDAEAAREALKFNTYALMLVCTLDDNGFLIMASFDSKCISKDAMERVLVVMNRIVTAFLGNPESKLGDVAVLDPAETQDAEAMRPRDVMTDSGIGTSPVDSPKLEAAMKALSPNEEKLRSILGRILGMPETEINPSDSFFELGGDSIGAMRLVSDARAQGLTLTVTQVFQSQSLAELAASIGNEKEDKLLDILGRILGMPKSEINGGDSFFELGGDSIGAMRLVSDARAQGLEITVAQVFQNQSLSELASSAKETSSSQTQAKSNTPYAALGKEASLYSPDRIGAYLQDQSWEIADIYPTRPLQQLAVEGTVDLPRYSLRYELIKFATPVDRQKLEQSCQELVARNEVLRTVFVKDESKVLGVVLSSLQVPYTEIAVPDSEDINAFAQANIKKDIEAPKPHGSSFVSFMLFSNAKSGASTLVFRISHAQYDEICLPILYEQLSALYAGTEVPETMPFSRHVNHVVLDNMPKAIPYWQNLLSGSQMSIMKPDIPLTHRGPADVYMEFDISARPANITIGSLPTAAWALVLSRRLSLKDVVFGEVVSGRNIGAPNADRIFGPTWQYIPFRVPFNSSWTYLDLLNFVQHQHITSAAYESMGFTEIVENCTDWDAKKVGWFDTVVHQAPAWVEEMPFGNGVEAKFETLYPHGEPLREWKCQAFVKDGGKKLGIEIVTFAEWIDVAKGVLEEVGEALGCLTKSRAGEKIFEGGDAGAVNAETGEQSLMDFEGVM
ncbi:uncharacterized protein ALTATR162_LOCUS529 [Alternaria atra]|uniref:Carrier domain-containing protein n=1 Tax=Alternaria atra TaxID=119953 RepID=A0A8J2HRM7_9PLEO|nr:uncharacterized protein ALTATR162_LOCUS529 [Alternaria atra]CAG5139628.1 unnamed protein product [Alternaria atra]